MKKTPLTAAVLLAAITVAMAKEPLAPPKGLDKCNVVWDSPSVDARGSMPLGNGDIGLNVWVEPSGDLVILIGKSDSFDEFNRLLKIGRLRVRTTPALVQPGQPFSQVLHLADGAIEIKSGTTSLRVWVDANHPVAQVDLKSTSPVHVQVLAEHWRKESRELTNGEKFSCWGNWPDKKRVNADTILPKKEGQLAWCHHNVESQWQRNLALTALGDEIARGKDPILNRTFGAVVRAKGSEAVSDTELRTTTPVTQFTAQILALTQFADTPHEWIKSAEALLGKSVRRSTESRFAAHQVWWRNFWNRSWIAVEQTSGVGLPVNAHTWKQGVDSSGGSRFGGEITGACILNRALNAGEIAGLAAQARAPSQTALTGTDAVLAQECTLVAWI